MKNRKFRNPQVILPAGRYWIGDAYNVLNEDSPCPEAESSTSMDGVWQDQFENEYYVDTAHIAAVPADMVVNLPKHPDAIIENVDCGHYFEFPEPFQCSINPDPSGQWNIIRFGHVEIQVP